MLISADVYDRGRTGACVVHAWVIDEAGVPIEIHIQARRDGAVVAGVDGGRQGGKAEVVVKGSGLTIGSSRITEPGVSIDVPVTGAIPASLDDAVRDSRQPCQLMIASIACLTRSASAAPTRRYCSRAPSRMKLLN